MNLKHFYIRIAAIVLVGTYLLGSIGVVVYTHYCSAMNIENSSLLSQLSLCNHDKENNKESATPMEASCCTTAHTACTANEQADDCCSNEESFIQLLLSFDLPNEKKSIETPEAVAVQFFTEKPNTSEDDLIEGRVFERPPPFVFQRHLIAFQQQHKIAPAPIA